MDNLRDQIIALANELQGEEDDDGDLGFVDNPGGNGTTEFVALQRDEFDHGHMYDEDGDPIPLPGEAMAGYIDDVFYYFTEHEKYGLSQKLRVTLDTTPGHRIMIQAGLFTNTGKGLLANLARVQDRGAKLTIEPSLPDNPEESPNVLFVDMYENGELIQDSGEEWPHEDQDVIDLFHFVREEVFGFEPQDVEPQLPDRRLFGGDGPGDGRDPSGRDPNGRASNERASNGLASDGGASDRRASDRRAGNQHRESNRPASHEGGARSRGRRRSA